MNSFLASAQQKFTLEQCKLFARDNYPKLKQAELLESISTLKNENTQSKYLPQIVLNGQATYQSEVIEINLPIEGFQFDPVSKDQYKAYLDIKQNIWDGGVSKSQQELENVALETNLQKLEIDAQQLNTMVEGYFFNILLVDKSVEVITNQVELLSKQVERLESAVMLGAARQKDKMKLEVEVLLLQQKTAEMSSQKRTFVNMMGILIGQELENETTFELPLASIELADGNQRSELKYFELQQKQLVIGDQIISSLRNPKFFGFGQAGYGKPGFNMLKNEFSPYYLLGVGFNWKVIDWKNSKRNKEINEHNRQMIDLLKDDFIQKQKMQLAEVNNKISELNKQLEMDIKVVKMRGEITLSGASELQNGTITSTDYLIDVNAETNARLNYEMHKLQVVQAQVNFNTIKGY